MQLTDLVPYLLVFPEVTIELQIDCENVHSRFSEDAKISILDLGGDKPFNFFLVRLSRICDSRDLGFRIGDAASINSRS